MHLVYLIVIYICSSVLSLRKVGEWYLEDGVSLPSYCYKDDPDIVLNSSDFNVVAVSDGFVDKSLKMMRILRYKARFFAITAPRGFGKSTSLSMVKEFLSIPVDNLGRWKNKNVSRQHEIFQNLLIYNQSNVYFYKHFGKHAVLYMDLDIKTNASTYQEVMEILRNEIHNTYVRYEYLTRSFKLSKKDKSLCSRWCDKHLYKTFDKWHILNATLDLAGMLKTHFNRTVYVLVDGFDSIIMQAIYRANSTEFRNIVYLLTSQITKLYESDEYVHFGMLTGVSYIAFGGFANLKNFQVYKFLNCHPYAEMCGFLDIEVRKLISRPEFYLQHDLIKEIRMWYGGYFSKKQEEIFNPVSILSVIQQRTIGNYWVDEDHVENLKVFFRHPYLLGLIQRVIAINYIPTPPYNTLDPNHILELRKLYSANSFDELPERDIIFAHFVEIGFSISSPPDPISLLAAVKVPNLEIQEFLMSEFVKEFKSQGEEQLKTAMHNITEGIKSQLSKLAFLRWVKTKFQYLKHGWGRKYELMQLYKFFKRYNITIFED